jgi:hypothetical protein
MVQQVVRALILILMIALCQVFLPLTARADYISLYLKGDGVPSASLSETTPTETILPNYDPSRDSDPGLYLQRGEGLGETDPLKYQMWVSSSNGISINGPVDLIFWSAVQDFDTVKRGIVRAGLYECDPDGSNPTLIAEGQKDMDPWSGGSGTWVEHTIAFGNITRTIAAGRSLALKVVVDTDSDDGMWFAYDTLSYPSRLFVASFPASDISIDCDFSDWMDGDGTEFVIDDMGGQNDWSSPKKLDITRFGIDSNHIDTLYVLFGYDDVPPAGTVAAILIDTDLDDNANLAFVITADDPGTMVELYSGDDTLSYGLENPVLVKTYGPSDFCAGSASGPWDTDWFVEAGLPFGDMEFSGGYCLLTSMISYADTSFLSSPRDSIFGVGSQNYDQRIIYNTDGGTAQVIDVPTAPCISGTVYADEGVSPVGSGYMVRVLANGTDIGSHQTDSIGGFYIPASINADDTILVYIDNAVGCQGNTVTVSDGGQLSDVDIYCDHVITRHDNGGTLSTATMASAKGGATDSDILYSVSGGTNLTVTGTGTELYLPTGYGFAPGGDITTPNMKNLGTFTGGTGTIDINGTLALSDGSFTATSGTMSVAGDFTRAGGTFTHNSGTVTLDGTGQAISGSTTFNNLTKTAAATDTLTFEAGFTETIVGTVTLTGAGGNLLNLRSSIEDTPWNFTVNAGATKDISYVDVKDSDASGSDATQKPINPTYSVDSGNCIDWFSLLPDIIMVKSVQTFSDPYNGETNPKGIPGAVMLYTVSATNQGIGATDADTVFLTDPIPVNTELFVGDINGVGSGPVLFTDGTPPDDSGLTYTFTGLNIFTDDVDFSSDDGSSYTYVPVPDTDGFDANVTHMRINPKGTFKAASGGDIPTFEVKFKVRVE